MTTPAVRAYTRGGEKPSTEAARKAFDELVENVKLENCVYFPDVVNAILRRVPGRVEAENYGHDGPNESYFVNNTSQKSQYYRTSESVPVEQIAGAGRRSAEQGIKLTAGEWTAYTIHSRTARDYSTVMRVKADSGPAVIELSTNGHTQTVTIASAEWSEMPLKATTFSEGLNRLKVLVKSGVVSLDWVAFN